MTIEKTIRCYILENFLFTDDESALNSQRSFIEAGLIDSTGILEIILFVEETFGVKVDDEEMLPENLDSVNNLVAFIGRKQLALAA
ncbi:MAG: acyl carrier protein [Candidatus Competibacteraceae bacterium]|nr:acyl carrier protein [Candidatus Competibacteraceae bacterium]MBK7984943.1 acyl carrier protein [Candidatus Competibacteraceae bacterium]MBK8895972.1 acyl carrier protein [Candidatus Competibacteraceae bacterium]MBK8962649.1 acyl carrier protein [Candidatus Competibacteraceae bacterium]MBK9953425.1 acyl carrier protein [Candidatus Competibacteraceae bacterium]